jgi:hypothetical protein
MQKKLLCKSKMQYKENMKRKYHDDDSTQKHLVTNDLDYFISHFFDKLKEGSCYICSVCKSLLYRKSVRCLERERYISVTETMFTDKNSFDGKKYICLTCHKNI